MKRVQALPDINHQSQNNAWLYYSSRSNIARRACVADCRHMSLWHKQLQLLEKLLSDGVPAGKA
jgi:hypothetical protein